MVQASERIDMIERRLREALEPDLLEVKDESEAHRGHAGAASGAGHFRVTIVSERFAERGRVARHRLLYDALTDAMESEIHALAIHAYTPDEWQSRGS